MPLRIEKLFQEYNLPGSFAVASVLTLLALVTLVIKAGLEKRVTRKAQCAGDGAGGQSMNAQSPDARVAAYPVENSGTAAADRVTGIEVKNVSKTFGAFAALDNVSFNVAAGELSRCWGRPAPARRRCFGSSPAWSCRHGTVLRRRGCDHTQRP